MLSTDTLWRLCRKLIHEKSDGLVLSELFGESPNLTKEDRKIIYSTAKDSVGDKAKIILWHWYTQLENLLSIQKWQMI